MDGITSKEDPVVLCGLGGDPLADLVDGPPATFLEVESEGGEDGLDTLSD